MLAKCLFVKIVYMNIFNIFLLVNNYELVTFNDAGSNSDYSIDICNGLVSIL